MSVDDGREVVRQFWDRVFGQGDMESMDEIFASNFRPHDLVSEERRNLWKLKGIIRDTRDAVPGISVEVVDQRLDVDDRVFTHFTAHVPPPQDGAYGDAPPPAEGWTYTGLSISFVSDGRIQESWLLWEAIRASQELSEYFGAGNWRWPPWS